MVARSLNNQGTKYNIFETLIIQLIGFIKRGSDERHNLN